MIGVVTGGRDHWLSLGSLELLAGELTNRGVELLRDGDCVTGVDRVARRWIGIRGYARVEWWTPDWAGLGKKAGPIRNREMLSGIKHGTSEVAEPPAEVLFAFAGGSGTRDCVEAAGELGIKVVPIRAVVEPRPWNRHHGTPPGPSRYIGRGSPLGNPFPVDISKGETRAQAAPRALDEYRRWLWSKLQPGSDQDKAVIAELDAITSDDFLVCSCWPAHCHAEVAIKAWRYRQMVLAKGLG